MKMTYRFAAVVYFSAVRHFQVLQIQQLIGRCYAAYYCAVFLIGRIVRLVCPSLCLSVRPIRAHNSKTKRRKKLKSMRTFLRVIPRLHDGANIEQTSSNYSTRRARVF